MKLTKAQTQAIKTLKAKFPQEAQPVFAIYDNETRRQISSATMNALVDAGQLKVKRVTTYSEDVKGRFGRGPVVSTRYRVEAEYVWA